MTPSLNNTFCYFPFYQLALKKWNNDGIANASPCCNAIRPETPDPLKINNRLITEKPSPNEIFHGPEMTELRESILKGQRHPACDTCWKMEDIGNTNSFRMHSEPQFIKSSDELDNIIKNPKMSSIDLILGENCNLRCRMCSPGLSNSLRKDYRMFASQGIDDANSIPDFEWKTNNEEQHHRWLDTKSHTKSFAWVKDNDPQWQTILNNIHDIRHIKATGGETTITKPWLEFLDYAIETGASKNIILEFHTNATKFTDNLVNKLSYFAKVNINLSIDSIGKNYEYLRYPMKWDVLEKSLNILFKKVIDKDIKNLSTSFNPVISALNIHYIKEISDYWKNMRCNTDIASDFFPISVYPSNRGISFKHLLPDTKKQLLLELTAYEIELKASIEPGYTLEPILNDLKDFVNYYPSSEEKIRLFKEVRAFDTVRNQSYKDYCHVELSDYLDSIAKEYNLSKKSPIEMKKTNEF
jgi:MoaA/NifB/PqqE/SkfB family radical SAM enzyme